MDNKGARGKLFEKEERLLSEMGMKKQRESKFQVLRILKQL
jgi:hypothetical protein